MTPTGVSSHPPHARGTGVLPRAGDGSRVPRPPLAVRQAGAGMVTLAVAEPMGGPALARTAIGQLLGERAAGSVPARRQGERRWRSACRCGRRATDGRRPAP